MWSNSSLPSLPSVNRFALIPKPGGKLLHLMGSPFCILHSSTTRRVKFERPGTGRHLHVLECSKGIHALRDPRIDCLNPLGNFLPEGWIESCGIGSVLEGGDETLVH